MPTRHFQTMTGAEGQERMTTLTLPSRNITEADAAIDYAEAHELMLTVEMDPGEFAVNPDEARAIWDELAPGESFTVVALMTVEEYEAKQEAEAEARRVDAYLRKFREDEARERAQARARIVPALTPPALADALAEFVVQMGRIGTGAEHMTCKEAEAIAGVLRAVGHEDEAEEFLDSHAAADSEETDLHRDRSTAPAQNS